VAEVALLVVPHTEVAPVRAERIFGIRDQASEPLRCTAGGLLGAVVDCGDCRRAAAVVARALKRR